jgi:hypothetical protein
MTTLSVILERHGSGEKVTGEVAPSAVLVSIKPLTEAAD